MTLFAQSSGTIGAILVVMAVVAWLETVIPLHVGARSSRAHLAPNLALTFITFGTNVFLNAAVVSTLALLPASRFGVLNRFPLPPPSANTPARASSVTPSWQCSPSRSAPG